jgi:hypothetical protein
MAFQFTIFLLKAIPGWRLGGNRFEFWTMSVMTFCTDENIFGPVPKTGSFAVDSKLPVSVNHAMAFSTELVYLCEENQFSLA